MVMMCAIHSYCSLPNPLCDLSSTVVFRLVITVLDYSIQAPHDHTKHNNDPPPFPLHLRSAYAPHSRFFMMLNTLRQILCGCFCTTQEDLRPQLLVNENTPLIPQIIEPS